MVTTCQGITFSRLSSLRFHRSLIWNFLAAQRKNMNIWLKVRNHQQVPTFRKLQLEDVCSVFLCPHFIKLFKLKKMLINVEFIFYLTHPFHLNTTNMTWKQVSVASVLLVFSLQADLRLPTFIPQS